ncbi:hypothetical protein [Nostoc sp. CHAB 5715]|uniref:hypothetical protein n=1 Tax=Nostoc sp. CHAB 5715 TaxID=2780400 RepID=UPI001E39A55C|nr:hypothetical protein [Nostoc sp. CHAB 5715]MCC5621690.1 hypothetical protein [Nostoc sp. CHAB 5715]
MGSGEWGVGSMGSRGSRGAREKVFPSAKSTPPLEPLSHAPCPMSHAPCPMPHAPCPMPNAQCPMPNALCPMLYSAAVEVKDIVSHNTI